MESAFPLDSLWIQPFAMISDGMYFQTREKEITLILVSNQLERNKPKMGLRKNQQVRQ